MQTALLQQRWGEETSRQMHSLTQIPLIRLRLSVGSTSNQIPHFSLTSLLAHTESLNGTDPKLLNWTIQFPDILSK
jgi:hypothetical protein